MTKVCHLSSAHVGLDVRIFHKECVSLAAAGYETHLVICASSRDVELAETEGVKLHALTPATGRLSRMFKQSWRCYRTGRNIDAEVYHFHDPELIPYGVLLRIAGKKVVYDVHEDLPRDILSKDWIPLSIRRAVSAGAEALEHLSSRVFFSVVTATPFIAARFRRVNPTSLDVNNYPVYSQFAAVPWSSRHSEICYVGNIGSVRGIRELIEAMGMLESDVRLQLCGRFGEPDVERQVKLLSGWQLVDEHGFLDRTGVHRILERTMVGIVTLHPLVNYIDALPVKMFEYMAAGIPVIASDFPKWREIIQSSGCGICVDPLRPEEIAHAIDYLVTHPEEARRMGENGRRAVLERYNWQIEENKLRTFYREVLSNS